MDETTACNGLCLDQMSVGLAGNAIVYAHPDCPLHAVSGDEHPSGLRDAIAAGIEAFELDFDADSHEAEVEHVERALRAWLSVVSEEEIDAAAEALCRFNVDPPDTDYTVEDDFQHMARVALAASRRVLIPRIESDENGGTK